MFRTYYVQLQEDYIVHAALYGVFSMRIEHIIKHVRILVQKHGKHTV
jgi:hypothetical protein